MIAVSPGERHGEGSPDRPMRKRAARAALWRLLDLAGGQMISFLAFTILARLLAPEDYGVVSLALAIVAVPSIILTEGLGTTLVQRDVITDHHITAALWANLGLSVLFVVLVQIGAGWTAQITGTVMLAPILRCFSVMLVATAATSIPTALYIRRMTYSTLARRTFIANSGGAILGTVMAFIGFGIWSLVAMQLCTATLSAFVMWQGLGWRPKPSFSAGAFRDMFHFTSRTMIANWLRFMTGNAATLIVGSFSGPKLLGYYYLIGKLLNMIGMLTMAPVDSVMLPVFSRMKDDPARRAETYCQMVGLGAAIWIPCISGLGILAPTLFPLLFGHKWDQAIPMIRIICPSIAASWPLTWPSVYLLLAAGRPGTYAWLSLIHLVTNIICYGAGVRFGAIGIASAYAAASIYMVPIHLWFVSRYAAVAALQILKSYLPALAASFVMVLLLLCLSAFMAPGVLTLLSEIGVSVVVYVAIYYALAASNVKQYLAVALEAVR